MIEKKVFKELLDHAEAHRIDIHQLMRIVKGQDSPVGDQNGFFREIPFGYRVCFSIEEQPGGWARHLSVSIASNENRYPGVEAVELIMKELGFVAPLQHCLIYLEENVRAVNVLEFFEQPKTEHEAAQ